MIVFALAPAPRCWPHTRLCPYLCHYLHPALWLSTEPEHSLVALNGYGGDQDYFFKFASDLPAKAAEHGFIFVAPMIYNYGHMLHLDGPDRLDEATTQA